MRYKTLIVCLARSHGKKAAEAAQDILDSMRASYTASNIGARPNTFTYMTTMYAYARSGGEDSANQDVDILDGMA